MTISVVDPVQRYTGTGANTILSTVFPFFVSADIVVTQRITATSVDTVMVLGVNYNVSGGSSSGAIGDVTPIDGATDFTSSMTWTIERLVPLTQDLDYVENDSFPAVSHESGLDRLTMQSQDRDATVGRSLSLPATDISGSGAYDAKSNKIENVDDPTADQDAATRIWVEAEIATALFTPSVIVSSAGAALIDDASADDQLTTLGGGTKGKAIFKDTTDAAVLTELGITSFIQTLLDDATVAAARTTLAVTEDVGVHQPSGVVNADFQIWQNGTSFTTPATDTYYADQHIILTENSSVVDIVSLTADIPAGCRGGAQFTQVTSNEKWASVSILDSQRSIALRGLPASFSIVARAGGGQTLLDMKLLLVSWSGTADAPAFTGTDLIATWQNATTVPSVGTNWAYIGSGTTIALTTSYQTFSIENETIPGGCNNLALMLVTLDSSFSSSTIVKTSAWNLVAGAKAKLFNGISREEEMRACQRFYTKTFPYEVAPVENVGNTIGTAVAYSNGTQALSILWRYPVEMLKDPNVVRYNPGASGTAMEELEGGADEATEINFKDTMRAIVESTSVVVADKNYAIHLTADARF